MNKDILDEITDKLNYIQVMIIFILGRIKQFISYFKLDYFI